MENNQYFVNYGGQRMSWTFNIEETLVDGYFISVCGMEDQVQWILNREQEMQYEVGDIVKLKKKHPCGSFEWEILRVGADFRLKCVGCGHQIMIPRPAVVKSTKDLIKGPKAQKNQAKKTCIRYKNMLLSITVVY